MNSYLSFPHFAEAFEMSNRQNISSGGKYEKIVGYSRAVRVGDTVFVSGTSGLGENESNFDSRKESYEQTKRAIQKIDDALRAAKCSLKDVVLTRIFLSRNADWKEVARAHSEFFAEILPTNSMLVCEFLDPKILVEVEAQAVVVTRTNP